MRRLALAVWAEVYKAHDTKLGRDVAIKILPTEQATMEAKRAVELEPLSLVNNTVLGLAIGMARHYDEAIDQLRKTQELDANFMPAHFYVGYVYNLKSMHQEAIKEYERALAISPGNTQVLGLLGYLGYSYAMAGRRADAQKVLGQLQEMSKEKYVSALSTSVVYVGLGDKEKA